MGGLSLPAILQAEATAGLTNNAKSIIMVFLPGGPPHQDLWEIKTEAPLEIRGEFKPISTAVPGIQIGELTPKLASIMDKLVVVRSLVGLKDEHASEVCYSGYPRSVAIQKHQPCLGSVVSKLQGPTTSGVHPFMSLVPNLGTKSWQQPGRPGYLGPLHAPFLPRDEARQDMILNDVSLERLSNRTSLLRSIDRIRRDADNSGIFEAVDDYTRQSLEVLTSKRLLNALDLSAEPLHVRERYGYGSLKNIVDAAPMYNEHFLMARRLVEAGVRCVSLAFGRWDSHSDPAFYGKNNFDQMRDFLPPLDQALSALVEDLHERGMQDDVSVIVWGEFGRTPRINARGGRDHWPQVGCAMLAGGGMPTGQAIGCTNRLGEVPQERPVHVQEVFATLYRNLGIDTRKTTLLDQRGRPQYLTDGHEPMRELA